jgi:hypothetical protein
MGRSRPRVTSDCVSKYNAMGVLLWYVVVLAANVRRKHDICINQVYKGVGWLTLKQREDNYIWLE